ncbi:hypothetical protein GCM10009430_43800 [Aquimarina litoralis]|uniref:Uncharacterized protein n=1 Tax=Aquimarina litoralis TaxID=584605 RepID=A0ABP3UHY4_9FLAO
MKNKKIQNFELKRTTISRLNQNQVKDGRANFVMKYLIQLILVVPVKMIAQIRLLSLIHNLIFDLKYFKD